MSSNDQQRMEHAICTGLYSIDILFVRPTTSDDASQREGIPDQVLKLAEVPAVPQANRCFSQLLNPEGVEVDFLVSHW